MSGDETWTAWKGEVQASMSDVAQRDGGNLMTQVGVDLTCLGIASPLTTMDASRSSGAT